MNYVELLSPAGTLEKLKIAIDFGANSAIHWRQAGGAFL